MNRIVAAAFRLCLTLKTLLIRRLSVAQTLTRGRKAQLGSSKSAAMKTSVVEQTQFRLVLQTKLIPAAKQNLGLDLVFAIFFLLLILTGISGFRTVQLTCIPKTLTEASCVQQSKILGKLQLPAQEMTQVTRAEIDANNNFTLLSKTDSFKIIDFPFQKDSIELSRQEAEELAATIKMLIQSGRKPFTMELDNMYTFEHRPLKFQIFIYSLVLMLILGKFYNLYRSEVLVFDTRTNRFIRILRTILGTRINSYSLSEITNIEVKVEIKEDKDTYYELWLQPKSICKRRIMHSYFLEEIHEIEEKIILLLKYIDSLE
jgi:hypothetical protein